MTRRILAALVCTVLGHDWRHGYNLAAGRGVDWCPRCDGLRWAP